MNDYNTIEIILFVLMAYSFSSWFVSSGKVKLLSHKRLWNSLLLFSFLVSAISGLLLAIQMDSGKVSGYYNQMLWWHVESGIIMAIISVFHIFWHISYYKSIFKFKK